MTVSFILNNPHFKEIYHNDKKAFLAWRLAACLDDDCVGGLSAAAMRP
jgi:hypothetical protein